MHVNVIIAFDVILVALRVNYYHSELLLGGVDWGWEEGLGGWRTRGGLAN